jgi:hypothetical protein
VAERFPQALGRGAEGTAGETSGPRGRGGGGPTASGGVGGSSEAPVQSRLKTVPHTSPEWRPKSQVPPLQMEASGYPSKRSQKTPRAPGVPKGK